MINQRRAFNRYTTTTVLYSPPINGYWDDDNQWVTDAVEPAIKIIATPLPYGNRDEGVFGEQLQARPELERVPAFMGFHTTMSLPIKSLIMVYGTTYIILQVGHYDAAGFQKHIGAKVQNLVLTEGVVPRISEEYVNQFVSCMKYKLEDIEETPKLKRTRTSKKSTINGWD